MPAGDVTTPTTPSRESWYSAVGGPALEGISVLGWRVGIAGSLGTRRRVILVCYLLLLSSILAGVE